MKEEKNNKINENRQQSVADCVGAKYTHNFVSFFFFHIYLLNY